MSHEVNITCYVSVRGFKVKNAPSREDAVVEAEKRLRIRLENLAGSDITGHMEPMFCKIGDVTVTDIEEI